MFEEKEILIPLHAQTLQRVDNKNRKVFVDLPDGLLEIYRNS
jgi:16S rRNA processing protein RimM